MISHADQDNLVLAPRPEEALGKRLYYLYDGADVALVVARSGTNWSVRQRIMSGGLDRPLVTRISPGGGVAQNLAFIADRQGTTLAAVRPDGFRDENVAYFGRNAFGKLEGAEGTGSSTNTETGFTGASTPNQTGGFTYLRNRWYDPATGRFLTQDPIGLAGGVNLYAYAGNNPVTFSDPFGLCPPCYPGNAGSYARMSIGQFKSFSEFANRPILSHSVSVDVSVTVAGMTRSLREPNKGRISIGTGAGVSVDVNVIANTAPKDAGTLDLGGDHLGASFGEGTLGLHLGLNVGSPIGITLPGSVDLTPGTPPVSQVAAPDANQRF